MNVAVKFVRAGLGESKGEALTRVQVSRVEGVAVIRSRRVLRRVQTRLVVPPCDLVADVNSQGVGVIGDVHH